MRPLPHHFKHTWYAHRSVKSLFGTFLMLSSPDLGRKPMYHPTKLGFVTSWPKYLAYVASAALANKIAGCSIDEFQARPPWLAAAYFKPIGGVLTNQGTRKKLPTWVLGAAIGLGFSASATEGLLRTFARHIPSPFAACRRWAQLSESPL